MKSRKVWVDNKQLSVDEILVYLDRLTKENQQLKATAARHQQVLDSLSRYIPGSATNRESDPAASLLDSLPVQLFYCDADGNVTFCNKGTNPVLARRIAGLPPRRGERLYSLHHPDGTDFPSDLLPVRQALRTGRPVADVELLIREEGGRETIVLVSAAPAEAHGRTFAGVCVFYDMTECINKRKWAEETVRKDEERFRLATDAARALVYDVDLRTGEILEVYGHQHLIGYLPDQGSRGRDWWWEQIHPEDRPRVEAERLRLWAKGGACVVEYRVRHGQGHYITVRDTATVLLDQSGRPERVVGGIVDFTEQKRAEHHWKVNSRRVSLLASASNRLLAADSPGVALQELCEEAMRELECDVFVSYRNHGRQGFHLDGYAGISPEIAREIEWQPNSSAICGTGVTEQRRSILCHVQQDACESTAVIRRLGVGAYACHPLVHQGSLIGTLSFGSTVKEEFQDDDLALMESFSNQVAIAVGRRLAEKELRRSNEKISKILGSITDCYCLFDTEWRFVEMNERAAEYFNRPRGSLLGEVLWEAFPQTRGSVFEHHFRDAMSTQIPVHFESNSVVVPGHSAELHAYPSPDSLSVYFRDITARKRGEQAIRKSEALLRTVLDVLPVSVFILDQEGQVVNANRAAEQLWGGIKQAGPDSYEDYKGWWPGTGQRVGAGEWAAARAVLNGESCLNQEVEIQAFTGARRFILDSAVPIRGANGEVTGAVVVDQDITDLRNFSQNLERLVAERTAVAEARAEQLRTLARELTRAEQSERRRVAEMLHNELQPLLVAGKLKCQALQTAAPHAGPDLSELEDLLRRAIDSSRSLSHQVCPPVLYREGLNAGLEWLAEEMEARFGLKVERRLQDHVQGESETVDAFLFSAVRELLFNVVKHAGTDSVGVELLALEKELIVRVSDEGKGFDLEVFNEIKNRGFGLYHIDERLSLFGGRLEIESAPGKGSRFTLIVPRHGAGGPNGT